VDIAANLQDQQYPSDDPISADLADTCAQLDQYPSEIPTAMLPLASPTERRLGKSSSETPVTGFTIGTDMISMYDCYCDTMNPANEGCTAKSLAFVEIITQAISKQAAEDFDPDNASNFFSDSQTNVEKHTTHLRQSGSMHASESSGASHVATLDSAVTSSMSEIELGLCPPTIITRVPHTGGWSLCIYTPVFDCDISWDPMAANCISSECGGGQFMKLKASVKICNDPLAVELEIKLCVDAISDILDAIGRYITGAEAFMNKFGIYSGCYRLAWAKYEVAKNRFQVEVGPHKYYIILNIFVEIAGVARMRFNVDECAYRDSWSWFQHEYYAKYARLSNGIIQDKLTDLMASGLQKWNSGGKDKCLLQASKWVYFSISFRVGMWWPFSKTVVSHVAVKGTASSVIDVAVGNSHENTRVITVSGLTDQYTCPSVVDKNNWDMKACSNHCNVGDTFAVSHSGNQVTIQRTDAVGPGWGMNLAFTCVRDALPNPKPGSNPGSNPAGLYSFARHFIWKW